MDRPFAPDPVAKLTTGAVFLAPVLVAASTIAYMMEGGMNRGQWGGVLQFYAWGVVAIAVVGLVGPLRERLPRTAALLLATGILAGVFGASYGIDSIWATVTGQPQLVDQEVTAGLVAMGPGGLVLPITLIGLGVAYARTGLVAAPVASLLALAGVLFPLGRAANLLPVAMATDVVLLVALVTIGRSVLSRPPARVPGQAPSVGSSHAAQ